MPVSLVPTLRLPHQFVPTPRLLPPRPHQVHLQEDQRPSEEENGEDNKEEDPVLQCQPECQTPSSSKSSKRKEEIQNPPPTQAAPQPRTPPSSQTRREAQKSIKLINQMTPPAALTRWLRGLVPGRSGSPASSPSSPIMLIGISREVIKWCWPK